MQPVIGLEIHVQLNTRSKMFSSAPNRFGDEPNVNIGIPDTAQPGALPVINREAVQKALLFALAIDAKIAPTCQFDRKSYFYPDSPRNFQITQFYHPIMSGGRVTTEGKTFEIEHAHLEDDAGMLKHFSSFAGVDYNRAGVPLLEIVSTPCMHSAEDAIAYAKAIKAIMEYIGASDTNMEEGSMRFDVNVSVRPEGSTELRGKTEIKNMNSFTNMQFAIEAEVARQVAFYEDNPNGEMENATYRFDPQTNGVVKMRTKERASDYRYFPEPDLPPLAITQEEIDHLRQNLPELPHERYARYTETLTPYSATILVNDKALSDYYEEALALCGNAKSLCNWITVEFVGRFKERGLSPSVIPAKHIAALVNMIDDKKITGKIAKKVADIMAEEPTKSPQSIVDENPDFQPMTDLSAIEPLVDEVLAQNPQSIEEFRAGKGRAFQYLVGQVMKASRGKADPAAVNALLNKRLGNG